MLKRSLLVAVGAAGSLLLHPATSAQALQPCVSDCAVLTVGDVDVPESGGTGALQVTFQQGPDDGQVNQGNDDTAAIAFSIGIPGGGAGLAQLPCNGGELDSSAVSVASAIDSDFAVIIENASCNARERCLCPTEGSQQRDDFINVVVYGPKNPPNGGPVEIPRLPDDGLILTLNLEAADGATDGQSTEMTVYCDIDGDPQGPEFTANLSIGDQSAVDQTADGDASQVQCSAGTLRIVEGGGCPPACVGDCNGDGTVAINELIQGVNISLGTLNISQCPAMDANCDGTVAINELIQAVNNALGGCS